MCVSTRQHPNGVAQISIPEEIFLLVSPVSVQRKPWQRASAMKWCGLSATSAPCVLISGSLICQCVLDICQ